MFIVYKKEKIFGHFIRKKDAINYMLDLFFDGVDGLKIKEVTLDELENRIQKKGII